MSIKKNSYSFVRADYMRTRKQTINVNSMNLCCFLEHNFYFLCGIEGIIKNHLSNYSELQNIWMLHFKR